jgi:tetratricopeptide (TPR) repeat protein
VATVLGSDRPASTEEEAALSQIPESTPAELLARLRGRIIATSPGSQRRFRLNWGTVLPVAAAAVAFAILFVLMHSYVVAPVRSRRLAAQAIAELVTIRQGTGRVPLRYISGFDRARVTRSGFDVVDPAEEAVEAAIESRFRRAVELAPREVQARLGLGLFLLDSGRLDESEAQLREAWELDPHSVRVINGLGVLYFERSRQDPDRAAELKREGLDLLQRAQAMDPENLMVSYNLAVFYQEMGSITAARRAWLAYLDRDRRSEWAQVARENLELIGGR